MHGALLGTRPAKLAKEYAGVNVEQIPVAELHSQSVDYGIDPYEWGCVDTKTRYTGGSHRNDREQYVYEVGK